MTYLVWPVGRKRKVVSENYLLRHMYKFDSIFYQVFSLSLGMKKKFFSHQSWGTETNGHPLNWLTNRKSITCERLHPLRHFCLSSFQFVWINCSKNSFMKPSSAPSLWAFGITNFRVNASLTTYFFPLFPLLFLHLLAPPLFCGLKRNLQQ